MSGHTLAYHSLHSGEADTVLVLQKFTDRTDTSVAKVIDIIIIAEAALKVHVIVNGSQNIFLRDMLGYKLADILLQSFGQLLGILAELVQNLLQNRVINQLADTELSGVAVNKIGQLNHHIGKNLHISLLSLDIYEGNRLILDGVSQLTGNLLTGGSDHLTGQGANHISSQNLVSDSVLQSELLIELISADLCQIVSAGVKEHGIDEAFSAFYTEGLTGTNLFI